MTFADLVLLTKKIAIGIIIFLVPLLIVAGSIWFLHYLLHQNH